MTIQNSAESKTPASDCAPSEAAVQVAIAAEGPPSPARGGRGIQTDDWFTMLWEDGPLLALVLVFVGVVLSCFGFHDFPLLRAEDVGYLQQARGGWFVLNPYHGPGYPWMIRLVHVTTQLSWFSSAQVVSLLSGALLVVATYRVGRQTGRGPALMAALMTAFVPIVLRSSWMLMSDLFATALVWITFMLLTQDDEPRWKPLALAGSVAGLAYLTRSVFGVLLLCPPMLLLATDSRARWVRPLLSFYGAFGLVVLPWCVFRWMESGNPFYDHNHLNIAFHMHHAGRGWNAFPTIEEYPSLGAVIRSDPERFFEVWWEGAQAIPRKLFGMMPVGGITLGVVGGVLWLAEMSVKKALIWVASGVYAALVAMLWFESRFVLPLIPLLALFVARGLAVIPAGISLHGFRWAPRIRLRQPILRVLVALCLLGVLVPRVDRIEEQLRRGEAPEYRQAVAWLRRHGVSRETVVMSAKSHIAFLAGATVQKYRPNNLQAAELKDLGPILERARVSYFVYDERYAARQFPQFETLLQPKGDQPAFLRPVHIIKEPHRLVIYEYVGNGATAD